MREEAGDLGPDAHLLGPKAHSLVRSELLAPDLEHELFTGDARITVTLREPTSRFVLSAAGLSVTQASIVAAGISQTATVTLDPPAQTLTLTVPQPVSGDRAYLRILYSAPLTRDLRGFYLSEARGRTYAVTQLEATDARRMFPSFDEPRYKATFDIRTLTPETALEAAQAALASCRKSDYQVSVAVVDRMGVAQVVLRDRYAGPHTPEVAVGKAFTAVSFRTNTVELADETQPGKPSSGIRAVPRVVAVGGSDTHKLKGNDEGFLPRAKLGEPTVWVKPDGPLTVESILAGLRQGNSFLSVSPNGPQLIFESEDPETLRIRAGGARGNTLMLIAGGNVLESHAIDRDDWSIATRFPLEEPYTRAQIVDQALNMKAISNPVWRDRGHD